MEKIQCSRGQIGNTINNDTINRLKNLALPFQLTRMENQIQEFDKLGSITKWNLIEKDMCKIII